MLKNESDGTDMEVQCPQPRCEATLENFYGPVINDVIANMQSTFVDEKNDIENLFELKQLWLLKLQSAMRIAQTNVATRTHVCKFNTMVRPPPQNEEESKPQSKEGESSGQQQQALLPSVSSKPSITINSQYVGRGPDGRYEKMIPLLVRFNGNPVKEVRVFVTDFQLRDNTVGKLLDEHLLVDINNMNAEEATRALQCMLDTHNGTPGTEAKCTQLMLKQQRIQFLQQQERFMKQNATKSGGPLFTFANLSPDPHQTIKVVHSKGKRTIGISVISNKPLGFKPGEIIQVDGGDDSSTEESSGGDEDDPLQMVEIDSSTDEDIDENGVDLELKRLLKECGDDDESEPEPDTQDDDSQEDEVEDTDNLIACQFTHVKRHKNHWKFRFNHGIVNVDGIEYVFQKATGEGIW